MTIFINGRQKRVRREPTIDEIPVDEFIRRNANPIWLHQHEMWEDMEEQPNESQQTFPRETRNPENDIPSDVPLTGIETYSPEVWVETFRLLSALLFRAIPRRIPCWDIAGAARIFMTNQDERERQRLADLYSGMADGELARIARDAASLTDVARLALEKEIGRRGNVETAENEEEDLPVSMDVVESREVVTLRKFRDMPEALLAKGSLDATGIECWLADDNMVRLDWFYSNLLGGIKLQVKQEDAEVANEILDQPIPENFDVEGIGDYQLPRCPNCQSLDITFEELNKPFAFVSAYFNMPIPLHRRAWRCHSCNHEWQDADLVAGQQP